MTNSPTSATNATASGHEERREAAGLLFIGDPHLRSSRPGRRADRDFAGTVLSKIDQAISHANERQLVPIFLGDLFDSPVEEDEALKTQLIRILRRAWATPIANVGNHDIRNAVLTDGDTLAVLASAGVLRVVAHSGAVETIMIGGRAFGLGATPFGQTIPRDVRPFFDHVDTVVWLTHHDIAFEKPYPGSIQPFQIAGCRMVVNGHMHLRKKSITAGRTHWINPGNITRLAIDAIDHVPAIWTLTADGRLEATVIPHERAVFDLTGRLIEPITPTAPAARKVEEADSAFVNLLKADNAMEMDRTSDGDVLLEEILHKLEQEEAPEDMRRIVLDLHAAAVRVVATAKS